MASTASLQIQTASVGGDALVKRALHILHLSTDGMAEYRERLSQPMALAAKQRKGKTGTLNLDSGGDTVTKLRPPMYRPLTGSPTGVIETAEAALRDSLTRCGELEHAALVTGTDESIAAYTAALQNVDAAFSAAWEARAMYALGARSLVDSRRRDLKQRIKDGAGEFAKRVDGYSAPDEALVNEMHELRKLYVELQAERPAPGATLDVAVEPAEVLVEPRAQAAQREENARISGKVARKMRKNKNTHS